MKSLAIESLLSTYIPLRTSSQHTCFSKQSNIVPGYTLMLFPGDVFLHSGMYQKPEVAREVKIALQAYPKSGHGLDREPVFIAIHLADLNLPWNGTPKS